MLCVRACAVQVLVQWLDLTAHDNSSRVVPEDAAYVALQVLHWWAQNPEALQLLDQTTNIRSVFIEEAIFSRTHPYAWRDCGLCVCVCAR